uniref:Fe-S-cluster containining protein n=1 Tax=Candidatus Kentrum sp. DK TaxID=2126562 RepID=A0A450SXJ6_9GAMM|nr:MAG: Fe-S-cluster containining protein [Candidatus Kentron sp. DK]
MTGKLPEITATSLLRHCYPCGSECCRYSSPIISPDEKDRIVTSYRKDFFIEQSTPTGNYFVIGRHADGSFREIDPQVGKSSPCGYLDTDGSCTIHNIKPLDCRTYPLRAVPNTVMDRIEWRFHRACPATPCINAEFLAAAQIIALTSLHRFAPETYMDWLHKYSPWALAPEAAFGLNRTEWPHQLQSSTEG